MRTLRDELCANLRGRVALVGIGNPDRGDDGFGVRLADAMRDLGYPDAIVAERTPERWIDRLVRGGFQTILFLDAVEMRGVPGHVVFLDAAQIAARHPQISTHKLSLGTLARLIEAERAARVFLLGVQPQSVAYAPGLSAPVGAALDTLRDLLADVLIGKTEPLALREERP